MITVHPPKSKKLTFKIHVDPYQRRIRFQAGKGGVHKDKRRKARVNERAKFRGNLD